MGRFEGALARKQETDPRTAEHAERLRRKKLELFQREQALTEQGDLLQKKLAIAKVQEVRKVADEEQGQRDRTEYLLKSPERFIMLSENEHALAESLLPEFEHRPTKSVINQLKKIQSELSFIQDHAQNLNVTPEITAVAKRNTKVLRDLEAAVGPMHHVKETSSVLEVLRRMALELEGRSATPTRSEYIGKHRAPASQPSSPTHEPKIIIQADKYQNPFASN